MDAIPGHWSSKWIRGSICKNDSCGKPPTESSVIQYSVELAVTNIWLACTAITKDWVAPPWIIKTSTLCHDRLSNPFNCLPCSNISQCTQRVKRDITCLTKHSMCHTGETRGVKWISESSYLFKTQEGLATFKVAFSQYTVSVL